ncbi:MAG: signal recognition particle-docking protein FtsY [Candidatus Micrarchaeia archaeon]
MGMFEGLKKKISGFVGAFAKKEESEEIKEEKKELESVGSVKEELKEVEKKESTTEDLTDERKEKRPEDARSNEQKAARTAAQKIDSRLSFATRAKSVFLKKVTIKEADVDDLAEQLRLTLLEANVGYDVAEKFTENLKRRLVGMSVDSSSIKEEIRSGVKNALLEALSKGNGIDIVELARAKREQGEPLKIMFIGPNGAGKTTTIAKVANLLIKSGLRCVIAAADTFRAAAIEQTVFHANKLGIDVVKGNYGADPSSIAFDAISFAKSRKIDAVLIDTAGRQETNKSLIEEIKKMVRVAKPDLKIFVGEGIAGNSILDQVKEFNAAVGIDGIILTKLDIDTKGGSTLTILSETSVPILFLGIGEGYGDLEPYSPEKIAESIVS